MATCPVSLEGTEGLLPSVQEPWPPPRGPKMVAACQVAHLYPRPGEGDEDKDQKGREPSFFCGGFTQAGGPPFNTCSISGHRGSTRGLQARGGVGETVLPLREPHGRTGPGLRTTPGFKKTSLRRRYRVTVWSEDCTRLRPGPQTWQVGLEGGNFRWPGLGLFEDFIKGWAGGAI